MTPDIEKLRARADAAAPPEFGVDPIAALREFEVTAEKVKNLQDARLIWRDLIAAAHLVCISGQAGSGKTALAMLAAAELALLGYMVLYFQEDAGASALAKLYEHAKLHRYMLLNSTLAGAAPEDQIAVLRDLVDSGMDLSKYVLIFDTLKKFSDLMSKGGTRSFLSLMRALTQRGATVVLLGHTNKHKGIDGKLVYEGVGDVRNDVDELLYVEATEKDEDGNVTITVKPDKVRCLVLACSFILDTKRMEVRPCERPVDVSAVVESQRRAKEDAPLIACITQALSPVGMSHTKLVECVMRLSGKSRTRVREVVDRYNSGDPTDADALWIETSTGHHNGRHIGLKPRGRT